MKSKILAIIKRIYVFIFAREYFFTFNTILHNLSLNGLGILNYENDSVSGEKKFIEFLTTNNLLSTGVILDVGANIGDYSIMLRKNRIEIPIYAFEPHPITFENLKISSSRFEFHSIPKGLGEINTHVKIYDYSEQVGSQHASIYKDVIEVIHNSPSKEFEIELITIDSFISENNIEQIALLKIDTEGNEKNVLEGAKNAIQNKKIQVIQIEFNEMNVVSRTFFKDILDLLPGYTFYRLLPDGMKPLGNYSSLRHEIFAFQNIVAFKQ
jgi:FkbM family methyltransferase